MSTGKRTTKAMKWVGIGLAGLGIVIAIAVWRAGSRIERRLAAIRAAGDPVSITDFHAEEVAPEKNAATYLRRAKSDAALLSTELDSIDENIGERTTYLDDAEIKAIESAFAAYPEVIPLLEQAADCTDYSVDYGRGAANAVDAIAIVDGNAMQGHMFARILCQYHSRLLLSKNKYDEAVQNCITLLKLCRLTEKDPGMVTFLCNGCACRGVAIRCANEALQSGRVSDSVRQELEDELATIGVRRAYLQALKSDRAFSLDEFEKIFANNLAGWVFRIRELPGYLDMYDWIIARATAALPENAANPPANISETPPSSGILSQLSLPALRASETAADRVEAEIRVIRVINALGRRENPEKPPLADRSGLGLSKSATTDPFNGKPLIVKKVDGGWLVYSVGKNEVDDGGDIDNPASSETPDIGLRPVIRTKAVAL